MPASRLDNAPGRNHFPSDSPEPFDDISESGYFADHEDEAELLQGFWHSLIGLVLYTFNIDGERQNDSLEDGRLPTLALPTRSRKRHNGRKVRRLRPSSITRLLKRALVTVPTLILMFLYVWLYNCLDSSLTPKAQWRHSHTTIVDWQSTSVLERGYLSPLVGGLE